MQCLGTRPKILFFGTINNSGLRIVSCGTFVPNERLLLFLQFVVNNPLHLLNNLSVVTLDYYGLSYQNVTCQLYGKCFCSKSAPAFLFILSYYLD